MNSRFAQLIADATDSTGVVDRKKLYEALTLTPDDPAALIVEACLFAQEIPKQIEQLLAAQKPADVSSDAFELPNAIAKSIKKQIETSLKIPSVEELQHHVQSLAEQSKNFESNSRDIVKEIRELPRLQKQLWLYRRSALIGNAVLALVAGVAIGAAVSVYGWRHFEDQYQRAAATLAHEYQQHGALLADLQKRGGRFEYYTGPDPSSGRPISAVIVGGKSVSVKSSFTDSHGQGVILIEPALK